MLTNEDLQALSSMMDIRLQDLSSSIDTKLQAQKQDIISQMVSVLSDQSEMLSKQIKVAETCIDIKIENEVCKRIDSLFDGYKLCHEQQWEMERRLRKVEERLGIIA